MKNSILLIGIFILALSVFGIFGEFYFYIPENICDLFSSTNTKLFHVACFSGLIAFMALLSTFLMIDSFDKKRLKNTIKTVTDYEYRIGKLNGYKVNYYKQRKEIRKLKEQTS